jgi:hypothetical protein
VVAEYEYLKIQHVSPSASATAVAVLVSPVVFSVTAYGGMGKVSETRDTSTDLLGQNSYMLCTSTILYATRVLRFYIKHSLSTIYHVDKH